MALYKSAYLKNLAVQQNVGIDAFSHSGFTSYLALFVTDPGPTGSGTEVTGGSYARQVISFLVNTDGTVENDTTITFSGMPATAVNYCAVFDALTGGNLLYYGPLTQSVTLPVGGTYPILPGNLIIAEE